MRTAITAWLGIFWVISNVHAAEFHVAIDGNDSNSGGKDAPFRTIQHAADLAQPGDLITVHEGVYRERINPPRGGESDEKRITYQAASGKHVEIRGSEVVKDWQRVQLDVWKATLPNSFFGNFNPYNDRIHGDWFKDKGREHHTGAVYIDGEWLSEAARLDDVLSTAADAQPLWFARVDQDNTTIWARFKGVDPNQRLVEINVRQTIFYPSKTGINYLTVRGFIMRHAATPWAPPTAEQIGLIGTNWSKGWIIEHNVVSHSICSGIALGKHGDEFDNTSANTAEGYVKTIERALARGWNKQTIGGHVVRDNVISHCEQAGIVGSLGCSFSTVTRNTIHDIHVRRLFSGAEMAGIKFHGAIDVEIRRNHIYRTTLGLWLDWMAQGARVSQNLFHDNGRDLFVEVDHGPFVVDNNLFLSEASLLNYSHGGAYAQNLFAGSIKVNAFDARLTPYHKAHSTELAGMHNNPAGDDRYYNNIFVKHADLTQYDTARLPSFFGGNVFLAGARPARAEVSPLIRDDIDPHLKVSQDGDAVVLSFNWSQGSATTPTRRLVTTELLANASVPNLPYEQRDGKPLCVASDYFDRPFPSVNPPAGPFAAGENVPTNIPVWPRPPEK